MKDYLFLHDVTDNSFEIRSVTGETMMQGTLPFEVATRVERALRILDGQVPFAYIEKAYNELEIAFKMLAPEPGERDG